MTPTATESSTMAIKMLADRYGEAWNCQDLDAIMDLHADDCVFVAHAAGSVRAEGKEAVREAFAGYIALLPDINFAERALHVGEGFWVLESSMTGTDEGDERLHVAGVSGVWGDWPDCTISRWRVPGSQVCSV